MLHGFRISFFPAFTTVMTALVVTVILAAQSVAQIDDVERPSTQELLPETTVLFFQIDNIRDFATKMNDSAIGNFFRDESVAPLVEDLWGQAKEAYATEVEEKIGLTLEDLQSFPAGELTFAVIAPRRKNPEFMLIIQIDEESEAVDRVLGRGQELLREDGKEIETETTDDGIVFQTYMEDGKKIKFFKHKGLLVGSSSEDEMDAFIDRWMGREVKKTRPLTENRKFVTIMNRCASKKELRPEMRIFVDPITLAKSATRGNFGAQVAINALPLLGLDGLLGVGGSLLMSEEEFASAFHIHVLLSNPRSGIFEMLAFSPTDYQPETWMPADIVSYITARLDVDKMLAEVTKMVEAFQGEGVVDKFFEEEVDENLGMNVREEILGALTGRVTIAQWNQKPARFNSQMNLIALELKNPTEFEEKLDNLLAAINDESDDEEGWVDETDYNGIRILGPSSERMERQRNERNDRRAERRAERRAQNGLDEDDDNDENGFRPDMLPMEPSLAIVGNYVMFSQSRELIRRVIDTDQGELESLIDSEDYAKINSRISQLLGSDMPSGIIFSRPVEQFRWMVEMAGGDDAKNLLESQSENKYVSGIKQAMEENPLPEFDTLEKYFPPNGGFMVSDDTGFHFLLFELRQDPNANEDE